MEKETDRRSFILTPFESMNTMIVKGGEQEKNHFVTVK